jgi:hypothetical protein
MTERPLGTRLKSTRSGLVTERWFDTSQPENPLAPFADSAAHCSRAATGTASAKCDPRVLHFHDNSKNGTRRGAACNSVETAGKSQRTLPGQRVLCWLGFLR